MIGVGSLLTPRGTAGRRPISLVRTRGRARGLLAVRPGSRRLQRAFIPCCSSKCFDIQPTSDCASLINPSNPEHFCNEVGPSKGVSTHLPGGLIRSTECLLKVLSERGIEPTLLPVLALQQHPQAQELRGSCANREPDSIADVPRAKLNRRWIRGMRMCIGGSTSIRQFCSPSTVVRG